MRFLAIAAVLLSAPVRAQTHGDLSVNALRSRYEFGEFARVESMAQALLDRGGLSADDLQQVHLYAGLAAFNLKRRDSSERHFAALLRLDPEHTLDPFLAPPPALRAFEDLRGRMGPELKAIRERRAAEADRAREEAQMREAQRLTLERQAREASARQADDRLRWVSFLPFGAGQFQQGRNGAGIAFATTEAVLAAVSLATFFAYQAQHTTPEVPVDNTGLGGPGLVRLVGIPRARQGRAEVLRAVNLGSSAALYAVYAGGVVEALLARPGPPPPEPASSASVGAGNVSFSWRF